MALMTAIGPFSLALLLSAEVVSQSVPVQFQGQWRVSLTECPPATTDRPIWINANRIRLDHSVGNVRVVEAHSDREVTLAGQLSSDGDPWNAKLQLLLSATGDELTISEDEWSVTLKRCAAT